MVWYGIQLAASDPAENALFAEMLPPGLRQRLNGWRLSLQETGRLVAPLFGAALFASAGGGSVAAFDSATFVVAALSIARLRLREPAPRPRTANWRTGLMAGFVHVRKTPVLGRLLATGGLVIVLSGFLVAAQYSLVQAIGEPPAFLGVLSACLGAGSIVASLVSGRLLRHVGEWWLAIFGMINFAASGAMRATGVLPLAVAGALVGGFALPWVFLAILSLAQRLTPLELQGRVSAAVSLVLFGPQAPVQALGSLAIRYATYRQIYVAGAVLALAAAVVSGASSRHASPIQDDSAGHSDLMKVSRPKVVELIRRLGYHQAAEIAERELPDPVDMDELMAFGDQHGISRDDLINRMGGSP